MAREGSWGGGVCSGIEGWGVCLQWRRKVARKIDTSWGFSQLTTDKQKQTTLPYTGATGLSWTYLLENIFRDAEQPLPSKSVCIDNTTTESEINVQFLFCPVFLFLLFFPFYLFSIEKRGVVPPPPPESAPGGV